ARASEIGAPGWFPRARPTPLHIVKLRGVSRHGRQSPRISLERLRMGLARRNIRVVVAQLLADVLRLRHRDYYPELRFMETVEVTVIVMAIFSAECNGKPLSALALSKHLEMPRATLLRRLSFLEARGEIRRDADGLRVNAALFATPSRDETIRHLRQTVIGAGTALSSIDTD